MRHKSSGWFVVLAVAIMAFVPCIVSAQEAEKEGWKFDTLTVSAGEDPLASGITGIVDLSNQSNWWLQVAVQHDQAWIMPGRKFKIGSGNGHVGFGFGHFEKAMWAGPYLEFSVPLYRAVSLGTMQWPGGFLTTPTGKKSPEFNLADNPYVWLASFQLSVGPVGFTMSRQAYLNDKVNWLPGVSYTQKVRNDFKVYASAIRNTNKKRWMYCIGGAKSFN